MKNIENITPAEESLLKKIIELDKDILNLSIHEIAELSFVSSSTVTRFVHKLGYKNLSKFRYDIAKGFFDKQKLIKCNEVEAIKANEDVYKSYEQILKEYEQIYKSINPKISKVINLIVNSKNIIGIGYGTSKLPVIALQNQLLKMGFSMMIPDNHETANHSIKFANKNGVIIIFSVKGNSRAIQNNLKIAEENNLKVILFTANENIKQNENLLVVPTKKIENFNKFIISDNVAQIILVDIITLTISRLINKIP